MEDEEEFLVDAEEEELLEDDLATDDAPPATAAVPETDETELPADESLDEILAKRPEDRPAPEEEEEEESILSLDRDERMETLSVRVVPKQETEFVCQKCHLVKPIRSQLADKKRMYCRDCA